MTQSELGWPNNPPFSNVVVVLTPSIPTNIIPAIGHTVAAANVNCLSNQVVSWPASTGTAPITYWVYGSVTNGFTANATSLLASGLSQLSYTNNFNMGVLGNTTNYYYIIEASNSLGAVYSAQVDLQQIIPLMSDDVTPYGTATASINASIAYDGFSFGYSGSTPVFWHGVDNTYPEQLQYTCTNTPLVTSYAIVDQNPNGTSTFNLEGYDGSSWHVLDTETESYTGNKTTSYSCTNTTTRYGSYRINFTGWASGGVGFVNCSFQIFGIP